MKKTSEIFDIILSEKELITLKKRLEKVERQLDKYRTSTIQDGWQTQRFAKKSLKWDYYSREKEIIKGLIEDLENKLGSRK